MERFLKIPHRVFLHLVRLSRREKCPPLALVYLALLHHADRRGLCFPGYRRIMELSGVRSQTTVARALRILEANGFLRIEREKGCVNRYALPPLHSLENSSPSAGVDLSTEWRTPLHSLENTSPLSGEELDPINYNHLTTPKELEKGERAKDGRRRKPFGMPEDPGLDAEYYLS